MAPPDQFGQVPLQFYTLFADHLSGSGKCSDKGKGEGLVKYAWATFMTPVPEAASFGALNAC